MEVYILDSLYRRIELVDNHESFIWTERFSAFGDFELLVNSTVQNRTRFTSGTRLATNDSARVMKVETVEDSTDAEGRNLLKLSGRSLEAILDDRVARGTLGDLETTPKWTLTGTPGEIAREIFHDICVTGILDAADVIPGIIEDSIFPADTIVEPIDPITVEIELTTVYLAIKNVCDLYNLGFRIVRDQDTSNIYFDVYAGSDRTTQQTTLPAVIFSPNLDNLQNTTELTTIAQYKNAAYVFSPVGHEIVYPLDIDPTITGFERHVIFVKADDITDTVPADATAKMIQRGREALSQNRAYSAFDGELNQNGDYIYGIDYNLGDLVELRNIDGVTNQMQVTEQIFVSDKEGERSYPTVSLNTFITPGSWLSYSPEEVWLDFDADSTAWADLP